VPTTGFKWHAYVVGPFHVGLEGGIGSPRISLAADSVFWENGCRQFKRRVSSVWNGLPFDFSNRYIGIGSLPNGDVGIVLQGLIERVLKAVVAVDKPKRSGFLKISFTDGGTRDGAPPRNP
jgi:hypothetical protein